MRTLILTQPELRSESLARQLQERGIATLAWPLLKVRAEPGLQAQALRDRLALADWAILPSPAAIAVVLGALEAAGLDWPVSTGLAVVGPGSAQTLAGWRLQVAGLDQARVIQALQPPFDADQLIEHPGLAGPGSRRVLVLRRADGRSDWFARLAARGHEVEALTVYRVEPLEPPAQARSWLHARHERQEGFAWSLTSAEAGARLAGWLHGHLPHEAVWLMGLPVLTVHPRLARVLAGAGWTDTCLHEPGADGMIQAVESRLNPS